VADDGGAVPGEAGVSPAGEGPAGGKGTGMSAHDDAALLIQIAQWSTQLGLQDATKTLWSEGFDPETSTIDDDAVATVLAFGETVGTLTSRGLIDTDLILDWLWMAGLWRQVAPAALKARARFGVPELYENFEALAAQQT